MMDIETVSWVYGKGLYYKKRAILAEIMCKIASAIS